jgi:Ser/Thr protein kinase RdoA (MazF antagonist)
MRREREYFNWGKVSCCAQNTGLLNCGRKIKDMTDNPATGTNRRDGMNKEHILQAVLERYKLDQAKTHLLGSLWNRVYRVETHNGQLYSLRLCHPVIQESQEVEDELTWLEFVANQGQVRVPRPVRNQGEGLVTTISTGKEKQLSCLFEWVEGEPARKNLTSRVMEQIGQAVGTLHEIAREFGNPLQHKDFRTNYRYDSSLAASHRGWIEEYEAEIGGEKTKLLYTAVEWLIEELTRIGEAGSNFGFIHADLHFGNFLVHDGEVSVIDFDQLGRGHYLYDLAVLMVELDYELTKSTDCWEKFMGGYQQVAALPFGKESELNPFIVAVNLAFLDWVYNTPNPEVRQQMAERLPATYESIRERIRS